MSNFTGNISIYWTLKYEEYVWKVGASENDVMFSFIYLFINETNNNNKQKKNDFSFHKDSD